MAGSTFELGLTRLWYLIGDWEGAGEAEDFGVRVQARFEWTLNDHFIAGFIEMRDSGSEQVLSTEHVYMYYDRAEKGVVGLFFSSDSAVERAVGHVDTVGRLVMTTTDLSCVPPGFPRSAMRRTFQLVSQDQWTYTIEMDSGNGLVHYITIQMRRKPLPKKNSGKSK